MWSDGDKNAHHDGCDRSTGMCAHLFVFPLLTSYKRLKPGSYFAYVKIQGTVQGQTIGIRTPFGTTIHVQIPSGE